MYQPKPCGDQVIYQLFPRVFHPNGTLSAAIPLLDHIATLGIDVIQLTPIVEADDDMDRTHWSKRQKASGYDNPQNPYRIRDYFAIDAEYGGDDDLLRFVERCHELGMRVILDLVYFHCGPRAVFLDEHPDFVKHNEDGSICCGEWAFPQLDFDNEALREYLWSNMEHFVLRFDIDGYRCDVGGMIPLDFWAEGRRRLDDLKAGCLMINETNGTLEEYQAGFDGSYGFHFKHHLHEFLKDQRPLADVRSAIDEQIELGIADRVLRGFDNHDIANDDYEQRTETVCQPAAAAAALALCCTLPGLPFIYNGQEVGDAGRHCMWANRFHPPVLSIDWSRGNMPAGRERIDILRQLIALRHQHPALAHGSFTWVANDHEDQVISFLRESDDEHLLLAINMSPDACETVLQTNDAWKAIYTVATEELRPQGDLLTVPLNPFGYCLLKPA